MARRLRPTSRPRRLLRLPRLRLRLLRLPPRLGPIAPRRLRRLAATAAPACGCNSCGCDSCDSHRWLNLIGDQCPLTCPDQTTKRLFENNCWLKCEGITVTGYVDAGISGRDQPRGDGFNGPDGFPDRDNEFQLNQIDTVVSKAVKPVACDWSWGFTIETLFGTDYRYPLARGLDAHDNGTPKWYIDNRKFYGVALPQAYLEFTQGTKLDCKIGHFYTLLGNEVVNPPRQLLLHPHLYVPVRLSVHPDRRRWNVHRERLRDLELRRQRRLGQLQRHRREPQLHGWCDAQELRQKDHVGLVLPGRQRAIRAVHGSGPGCQPLCQQHRVDQAT